MYYYFKYRWIFDIKLKFQFISNETFFFPKIQRFEFFYLKKTFKYIKISLFMNFKIFQQILKAQFQKIISSECEDKLK